MTGSLTRPRRTGRPLARQLPFAAATTAAAVLVVAGFALLAALVDEPFSMLSRDPAASLGASAYIGWFAYFGALVWLVGASCGLLAGATLHRTGSGPRGAFLLAAGAYTGLLAVDDLFQLHETVDTRLGVPEELVFLVYAGLLAALIWRFPDELAHHGAVLPGLALAFLAASVGLDVTHPTLGGHLHLFEDGSKLVGIALWSGFLVDAAFRDLLLAVRPPAGRARP